MPGTLIGHRSLIPNNQAIRFVVSYLSRLSNFILTIGSKIPPKGISPSVVHHSSFVLQECQAALRNSRRDIRLRFLHFIFHLLFSYFFTCNTRRLISKIVNIIVLYILTIPRDGGSFFQHWWTKELLALFPLHGFHDGSNVHFYSSKTKLLISKTYVHLPPNIRSKYARTTFVILGWPLDFLPRDSHPSTPYRKNLSNELFLPSSALRQITPCPS
ncbi:hypothetical protein Q3G72_007985 [Acer saccharum]|nr:hypothetical protein Q3G72_007985 [Acer saccharum]